MKKLKTTHATTIKSFQTYKVLFNLLSATIFVFFALSNTLQAQNARVGIHAVDDVETMDRFFEFPIEVFSCRGGTNLVLQSEALPSTVFAILTDSRHGSMITTGVLHSNGMLRFDFRNQPNGTYFLYLYNSDDELIRWFNIHKQPLAKPST